MRPKHWVAVSLFLLLGTLCASAGAQKDKKAPPTTIRVTVSVHDPTGVVVPGAGVVLRQESVDTGRMSKHPFNVEIHTDDKGLAEVQGFEPGIVLVQVIAHGFQTYGQAFIMKHATETVHIKLKPPKSQVSIYH